MSLPGLPGSIRRLHCHGWPSAGEKSLKLINTPSHSPNDGQASPCLNSHSTHIPILIACSILCLSLPHHCPIHAPNPQISDLSISPSVLGKSGYMLSLKFFDTVLMKTTQIHSSLQTPTPNLTPPSANITP